MNASGRPKHKVKLHLWTLFGCLTLAFATPAAASSVTLAWDPNPEPDIAGYKIYYGTSSGAYTVVVPVGNVTQTTISNLTPSVTYYFAATAFNEAALESDYSNEISWTATSSGTNAPPVISLAGSYNASKETATTLTGVSVTDADAGNGNVSVTFTADHGTIQLSTSVPGGLTSGQVTGNGTATVVANAPLNAFNNTAANTSGIRYQGALNFVGTDTLQIVANDNGNTGGNGAQSANANASIVVTGDNYDTWLNQSFPQNVISNPAMEDSLWGELADPDGDGQSNLMEYAVGENPIIPALATKAVTTAIVDVSGQKHLTITFRRRRNQTLIEYRPEVSPDRVNWYGNFANVQLISTVNINADFDRVTYRDVTSIQPGSPRFFRLRIVKD